ncbi:MAG: pyridoxine 5'-phosphate synthase [Gammaproteobacteria bacterium]|nr:pyridoxine 5'-phosphate synthase [Gammaproteobacteria bacterium]MDE1886922.1 pyridoxine 5'-phosphate synthase [Gammaproteobacteria bacterium]MDE2023067.1 pyridoxine 5'-phosphate synthase [Gammaproteobacteria bacterium]MDE2139624.1 pyridoxine 5'-phosphate synthase [Gammaproteobacteria bacterium]MDE2273577.1 pyridoxine 5'-phosphate synthase [Gammaproteobacteria bacterium]
MRDAIRLGVNIDHVATLRQARGTRYPDPVEAALLAESAGADSITVHLREDRRHIQERDVQLLRQVLQTRMNLEMAATAEMLAFACATRPEDCCLVPERRRELTTEGGLQLQAQRQTLTPVCAQLAEAGIRVALFIDPQPEQVEVAAQLRVPAVELHTGRYADAPDERAQAQELHRLRAAAQQAARLGIEVHAGHGLNYHNVMPVAAIAEIVELNIGHSIMARALMIGLPEAVRDMQGLMRQARGA